MNKNILKEVYENEINKFNDDKFIERLSKIDLSFKDENPIRNIIVHFLMHDLINLDDRLKYDCDAYYYKNELSKSDEESLFGDTLISFFMPYSACLYKITGRKFIKSNAGDMVELIEYIDKPDDKLIKVNEKFNEFASLCYTKGNFLYLPNRNMNNERGSLFQDRIDETIFNCFSGGKFYKYFDNDNSKVIDWIKNQNLNISLIFKCITKSINIQDEDIKKENIKCLIDPSSAKEKIDIERIRNFKTHWRFDSKKMDINEIYKYIDICVQIIKIRNGN